MVVGILEKFIFSGWILVQYIAECVIQVGHILLQALGILEEGFYTHGPELVHVTKCITPQVASSARYYIG